MPESLLKLELTGNQEFSCGFSPVLNLSNDNGSSFHGQIIEIICPIQGETRQLIAITLFSSGDQQIGYVVFNKSLHEDSATASINYLKTKKVQENLVFFPITIQKGIEASNVFDALRIHEEFQSQGYAEKLWLLGLMYLQEREIKQVEISGDITIGKMDPTKSFYTQLGAELVNGHEIVNIPAVIDANQEKIHKLLNYE